MEKDETYIKDETIADTFVTRNLIENFNFSDSYDNVSGKI